MSVIERIDISKARGCVFNCRHCELGPLSGDEIIDQYDETTVKRDIMGLFACPECHRQYLDVET